MPSASQDAPGSNLGIDRASNTIRLTRDFDSPRAEIFEAWTKPEPLVGRRGRSAGGLRDRPAARRFVPIRDQGPSGLALRRRLSRDRSARSPHFRGAWLNRTGADTRGRWQDPDDCGDRMRLQRTTRSVPQDGRQRRHGPDARQPRRLHAQPSVEGCLKVDRATPPSLRPSGQPRGVAIQGT
jgi:hypothetical protein